VAVVRDAETADGPALARLLDQLGYPASLAATAARVRRLAAAAADRLVVVEHDGEVAGLACLHVDLPVVSDVPVARITAIVVDRAHRRRGLGEALVSELEAEARRRGCDLLYLTTAERRADAHAFYGRLGFEQTGRRFAKPL
jgi:N-acetylglutamate synthase-like GNAT family acetyltransferase